jgi:hypothetical protein
VARLGADRSGRPARRRGRTLTVDGGGDRAADGATVVRAVVHARLLGLRLLTLDARVVVAPAELEPSSLDLMTPVAVHQVTADQGHALARRQPLASSDGGVSRARELLAEGTHTLAQSAGTA